MAKVDPFVIKWPQVWIQDPQIESAIKYLNRFLHDLWIRTGGGTDFIETITTLTNDNEQIEDLIPLTAKNFYSAVKTVSYTAVDGDFIEAQNNAIITLDPNANIDDQIMVANGDGSKIKVLGDIKYTKLDTSLFMNNQGTSLHFQYFGEYWRIR